MGVRAFAAVVTGFDEFLAVIPQPATVAHEQREQQSAHDVAGEVTADGLDAADETDDDRKKDREETGGNEFLDGAMRRDFDALVIFGNDAFLTFHQTGDFLELTMDFADHALGIAVNAKHQHGAEDGRNGRADDQAEEDERIHDVEEVDLRQTSGDRDLISFVDEGEEQGDDSKPGGADREALGHSLDGVAGRVEGVGDLDDFLTKIAHFREPAGVIDDRAVGIVADDHADDGQHPDRGDGNAEQRVVTAERFA